MSRRGRSFDWAPVPDEGDADGASRDVRAWLDGRGPARDWDGVLGRLRDALAGIARAPLVRGDPRCREILAGLADAADMAEVEAAVSALGRRIGEMRGDPPAAPATRFPPVAAPPRRTFEL